MNYIIEHKEWMFSGIGAAMLALIIKNVDTKSVLNSILGFIGTVIQFIFCAIRLRFCSDESLLEKIDIDVRPRGGGVEFWLQNMPRFDAWFRIINHTPFDIKVNKITVEVNFSGANITATSFCHDGQIKKHSSMSNFRVEGVLTTEQADFVANFKGENNTRITILAEIKIGSRELSYNSGSLENIATKLINSQHRIKKCEDKLVSIN